MKFRKLFIYLFLIVGTTSLHAQKKIGIFIHGFQGSSEKWSIESLAPEHLVFNDNILDGYVLLNYETSELNEDNLENLLLDFHNQIITGTCIKINNSCDSYSPNYQNDKYVLIGHSLGGLVARRLYPALKVSPFPDIDDLNIVGVINIGGPMQGSSAVASTSDDVTEIFSHLETTLTNAWNVRSPLIDFVVTNFIAGNSDIGSQISLVPEYLVTVRDSALGYVHHIETENANSIIGRDGSLIQALNSYPESDFALHPENYLSVIGSEKENIPLRIAGHIYSSVPDLQSEQETLERYDEFKDYFSAHVTVYNIEFDIQYSQNLVCRITHPFRPSKCKQYEDAFNLARERRETWKDASTEVQNIDSYWGELIDSYRIEEYNYQEFIPPCEDDERPGPMFDIQIPTESSCSPDPNGEWRTRTAYIKHAAKSDGVVNIHSALWSADDGFNDLNNSYYPDVLLNENGDDEGGFNHFELRNYERGYQLKDGNTIVFEKGDRAPQYDKIVDWLDILFNTL